MIGLTLNRSSRDVYRPTFHCHNLLRPFPTISLSLNVQLKAKNGAPTEISLKGHEARWQAAAAQMKEAALLPLDGDVSVDEFVSASSTWLSAQGTPYWPHVYADVALVLGWAGRPYRSYVDAAARELQSWPEHVIQRLGGVDAWRSRLLDEAGNEDLEEILQNEIERHKLGPLPHACLLT